MTTKIVHIHQDSDTESTSLSKAQKKFNSLIKKIDAQKKILQDWQDTIPKYQQRFHGEYQPFIEHYTQCRVDLVHLFDAAYNDSFFKKTDKAKLKALILDLSGDLIHEGREELKVIYNRYNDLDFDAESEEMNSSISQAMKSMFEDMYDMEFDESVDFSSPEKVQEAIAAKLQAEQEREAHRESKRTQRKKTTKQLEKEAREKEEEQNTSKSIQEVFRKLVAVLHPDREPDETERERKTALMQRVNDAYRKKDLLQLLALQLEIEQIDQQKLNTLADDRLKHFNKILQDQLNELEQEIGEIEFPFRVQLNVSPYAKLSPDSILKSLSISIRDIQFAIKDTQKELDALKDPVLLKSILKSYRL
ncbi:MAG: hypothetical protein RL755_379 [Pseudomonadota bacterium]